MIIFKQLISMIILLFSATDKNKSRKKSHIFGPVEPVAHRLPQNASAVNQHQSVHTGDCSHR